MGGIYIASKAKHGARWRALRAGGLPIVSTWIDESGPGETASYASLWTRNVNEAKAASVVIAYNEDGETMKGALVEIGAALGAGVPVLWVGPYEGQTVVEHPLVMKMSSLDQAIDAARAAFAYVAPTPTGVGLVYGQDPTTGEWRYAVEG